MYAVYFLTNQHNTTFYIGVTNNLIRRVYEHKQKFVQGFSQKYNLTKLIYYEQYEDIELAIKREKQLKNWHRSWKINLIRKTNPEFKDLYEIIL